MDLFFTFQFGTQNLKFYITLIRMWRNLLFINSCQLTAMISMTSNLTGPKLPKHAHL